MRRLPTVLLSVGLLAPAAVLAPVLHTATAPRPHPVAPQLHTVAPAFAAAPQPRAAGAVPSVTSAPQQGAGFSTLGVSWPASLPLTDEVQVRTRDGSGPWSDWTAVDAEDAAPSPGSPDAASAARQGAVVHSEPLFTGAADTVQTRVVGTATPPAGLRVTLIDPGTSAADADPSGTVRSPNAASAAPSQPGIYTRAQWGADESLRSRNAGCGTPDYASTVKVAFVHHTDGTNDYTAAQVPAIIRGIYAYHVLSNGWCDIGYNFLVDRFGQVWEGRYGGVTKAVIGAQAGGFNTMSTGVALLGTFSTVTPPAPMVNALEDLLAWKLSLSYDDPTGMTSLVSGGGPDTAYPAGQVVPLHVISGHRDVDQTSCPGQAAYDLLPAIRAAVRARLGTALVQPSVQVQQPAAWSQPTVAFASGLTAPSPWTFTLADAGGTAVATTSGAGGSITGTITGAEVTGGRLVPGTYTATITAGSALPFRQQIVVKSFPDVYEIGVSGGHAVVQSRTGASTWNTAGVDATTPLAVDDPASWRFFLASYNNDHAADLYAVHLYDTGSGDVEVHVLSAASGYQTYVAHIATALAAVSPDQFAFALGPYGGDGAEDLYAIAFAGTGSGMTEVHVLGAAGGYRSFLGHWATPLGPSTPGTFDFEVSAPYGDLVAVARSGASGHAEAHVLTEASHYRTFSLHQALPLAPQPSTTRFQVVDLTGDGVPDLVVLIQQDTGSGYAEVHALDGATAYTTWAVHAATGFPEMDPTVWQEAFAS
ncbi:MAG TPA: N-acetylmuramoyl-L-alanine amidase [Mycobacteriales bacterium]